MWPFKKKEEIKRHGYMLLPETDITVDELTKIVSFLHTRYQYAWSIACEAEGVLYPNYEDLQANVMRHFKKKEIISTKKKK